ncbi:DMT family transporter [Oceanomicrobium pacificus]|uniref:EamA family transporter n=1 Tax=Oceanomicrobium pacificus TaxID=2692916 RepID=A0A6B0TWI9_9RHOB|nr:DMT family transporter [Oceanomicrobium pacificus]MXU65524.1 EamA family transporter [Oceanomicrobium pacificus]
MSQPTPSLTSWILLLSLAVIWGASFLAVEIALIDLPPLMVAALRVALAALLLVAYAVTLGPGLPPVGTATGKRIWLHCAGMGIFSNALPFSLLSWGQQHVTSSFAGLTMAVVPLFVLPLAHLLVPGERMSVRRSLGFGIGFLGVIVLLGPQTILAGPEGSGPVALARLACIAAAGCYACGAIITRLSPPTHMLSFSAGGLLIGAVVLMPVAVALEGWPSEIGAGPLAAVLYLAVLPTAVATILLVRVIADAGPSFLSLVNYQVPVWAMLFGALLLSEPITLQFGLALGLILAGLFVSQTGRTSKRAAAAPEPVVSK